MAADWRSVSCHVFAPIIRASLPLLARHRTAFTAASSRSVLASGGKTGHIPYSRIPSLSPVMCQNSIGAYRCAHVKGMQFWQSFLHWRTLQVKRSPTHLVGDCQEAVQVDWAPRRLSTDAVACTSCLGKAWKQGSSTSYLPANLLVTEAKGYGIVMHWSATSLY